MLGGRKLSSAQLQLLILSLVAEGSAHGYELIQTIETRSGGFYVPSPGMIYPALTYLEEIGHAVVMPEGNRKSYSPTEAGRAYLQEHREEVELISDTLQRIGRRMPEVREAFAGIDSPDQPSSQELHRARHALGHALRRKSGCSVEETLRIARILDAAAVDILQENDGA